MGIPWQKLPEMSRHCAPYALGLVVTLLPSLGFAHGCGCGGAGSVLSFLALSLVAILVAAPLGVAGVVILAVLVARGVLRRQTPWMQVAFRGFPVALVAAGLVTVGSRYAGLLCNGHWLTGVSAVVALSSALQGTYLYISVAGFRGPRLPGA